MKKTSIRLIPMGLVTILLCLLPSEPARAGDVSLASIGVRGGVSGLSILGDAAQEDYVQWDLDATFRLPWSWYHRSDWGLGSKLLVSAGALIGAKEPGFLGTLVPEITFGPKKEWISFHIGGGIGLMSKWEFGEQDFGGPFQFIANLGVTIVPFHPIGVGYQFQHISDSHIYGDKSRGVDMHLVEASYRF